MIYPDDFPNPTVYQLRGHHYAIADNTWYRLWGWVPHGGRDVTAVTDAELIAQLDHHAREWPSGGQDQ